MATKNDREYYDREFGTFNTFKQNASSLLRNI